MISFKEVEVWKDSVKLCTNVYNITSNILYKKDYALLQQIRKSVISIPSNIAEGFERKSNKEFIHFLYIAKASAGELLTQLIISKNINFIQQDEFLILEKDIEKIMKSLGGFIKYLKNS